MSKILLVEDDLTLAEFLKESLVAHTIDHVADGTEALHWLKNEYYAAAILDWNLPGLSGVEICKTFRQGGGTTPIIMLTGKGQLDELAEGLDSGADDYLVKPFEITELRARLKALLRRAPALQPEQLAVGLIRLDAGTGEVMVDGKRVQLTRRELGILELLMRNPGHAISPRAIMDRVWPSESDASPENLRSHINRLRIRLGAVSVTAAQSIKSLYGLGYKIEPNTQETA